MDNNKLIPINSSVALAKTAFALSLTDKLTFNQNRKMVKEIFLSNKEFFIDIISEYYLLNIELIEKYQQYWSWYRISKNKLLIWSETSIEKYLEKLDFKSFDFSGVKLSLIEDFIEKRFDESEWEDLSEKELFPWSESFIEKHFAKWNWVGLSSNEALPWSENFIEKYVDKWNWGPYWEMYGLGGLSSNKALPWSEYLIEKYMNRWSWNCLSFNKALPWSESLIDKYIDKWDWGILSWNEYLPWSNEFINKYSGYTNLASSPS